MRNYSKIIIVLVMATLLVSSCEKDDAKDSLTCNVANPAEELPWLKTMIESWEDNSTIYTYMYVQKGTYSGKTVFLAANCCPFCNSYFPVFDCDGEEIAVTNIQDITGLKTIWKPANSQCTF
jgi:thiol-disulfide isomerase/thioredoxin